MNGGTVLVAKQSELGRYLALVYDVLLSGQVIARPKQSQCTQVFPSPFNLT